MLCASLLNTKFRALHHACLPSPEDGCRPAAQASWIDLQIAEGHKLPAERGVWEAQPPVVRLASGMLLLQPGIALVKAVLKLATDERSRP